MEIILLVLSLLLVNGVSGEEITVKVGERLPFGVEKTPDQTFLWYFEGVLIAQINGNKRTTCLYYGVDGMFRDRLQVHNNTGDLIINNVAVEHSGLYEANDLSNTDGKTETFGNPKTQKCNSTKINRVKFGNNIKTFIVTVRETEMSPGAIAGISVGGGVVLLLAAAAGVIYNQRRNRRKYPEKNKKALMSTDEKTIGV